MRQTRTTLLEGIQDGFVISFWKEKKKKCICIFRKYFEVVWSYVNDFQEMHKDSKWDIQPDIHDICQFVIRRLYRYSYKTCSI